MPEKRKIVIADLNRPTPELAKKLGITAADVERIRRHLPQKGTETDENRTAAS
jgi:hypothetical protein